jgi:hypothetical protein
MYNTNKKIALPINIDMCKYFFEFKTNNLELYFFSLERINEVEIFSGSDANQYTGKSSVDYQISVKTNFYGY